MILFAVWSVRIIRLFSATLSLAARMRERGLPFSLRANLGSTPRVATLQVYLHYNILINSIISPVGLRR